jgi:3-dehydroquinate dehydratase I
LLRLACKDPEHASSSTIYERKRYMKKVVKIKDILIGEGMPKICVPMVGETISELMEEAASLKNLDFDIVEWRADFYEKAADIDSVKEALYEIKSILANKPVMFTFRSSREGGHKETSIQGYIELNKAVAGSELVDIIDVELNMEAKVVRELVKEAHANEIAVIISNHDFKKTPPKEEIISKMKRAFELGGDIFKIAVMPNSTADVITLLDATRIMKEECASGPVIAISMAGRGVVSRVFGELFGSALTFGTSKKGSAPGQMPADDLRRMLQILHNNI